MLITAAALTLALPGMASAQPAGCTLTPDERNPTEKVLRCGDDLTLRSARGTQYKLITKGPPLPSGAELNSGALLIEGTHDFQILTTISSPPRRCAAPNGPCRSRPSRPPALVLSGVVEVTRGKQKVPLRAGEGVDVSPGSARRCKSSAGSRSV